MILGVNHLITQFEFVIKQLFLHMKISKYFSFSGIFNFYQIQSRILSYRYLTFLK